MKGDKIIRKTDFVNWNGVDPYRHGGVVTLVMELDPNRRRMTLGFSFCKPEDQFIKREGVKYAMERLRDCPIEIPVLYQADHAAGEVLKALCLRDWSTLEQVTTLEIHTEAWRRGVPSWAKKWYKKTMCPEPENPLDTLGRAVSGLADDILEEATGRAVDYITPRIIRMAVTIEELKALTAKMFTMTEESRDPGFCQGALAEERKH
jgi:hypothetical protein